LVLRPEDPTIAELLKPLGYVVDECLVIRALRGVLGGFLICRQQLRRPELKRQLVDGPGEAGIL
jgi:hypothetical protein